MGNTTRREAGDMSEPQITHMTTTNEPTTDLHNQIQAVLDRHQPERNEWNIFGLKSAEFICSRCRTQSRHCDAHRTATALLEAVTALEAVERDTYGDWESDPHAWMDSIRESAQAALATIAAKLDGADDDN